MLQLCLFQNEGPRTQHLSCIRGKSAVSKPVTDQELRHEVKVAAFCQVEVELEVLAGRCRSSPSQCGIIAADRDRKIPAKQNRSTLDEVPKDQRGEDIAAETEC